jgi:hypothetical protein
MPLQFSFCIILTRKLQKKLQIKQNQILGFIFKNIFLVISTIIKYSE